MRLLLAFILLVILPFSQIVAQTIRAGDLMFIGYNADGDEGIAFITLIDLPDTTIYFTDNEWNGSAIGSGGNFNNFNEGILSWNSGGNISAGTVIIIDRASTAFINSSIGTVSRTNNFDPATSNEVVYMYLGNNLTDPVLFISAIANDGFGNGTLNGTNLTAGINAIDIRADTGERDEDIMVFDCNCAGNVPVNALVIANGNNWATQDGTGGNNHTDGTYPNFPADVCREKRTYYSRRNGNWDNRNTWSFSSDGSSGPVPAGDWPRRLDNVVIQNNHRITVNARDDNMCSPVVPDNMGRSNVGNSFNDSNQSYLYHTGDILVENGGVLSSTVRVMVEGYTRVEGTFNVGSDMVNLGHLEVTPSGVLGGRATSDIDLTLSGSSTTIINSIANSNGTNTNFDDLNIDHTGATLCGIGLDLTEGNPSVIRFSNSATADQICADMLVTCTATNCGNGNGTSGQGDINLSNPLGGSGPVIVGNTGPAGVGETNGASPLILWLDASRGVFSDAGVTASPHGGAVQQWNDQSGTGNHAIQGSAGNRPLFNASDAGINNTPSVEFSIPRATYMDIHSLTLDPSASSFTIISVLNCNCSGTENKVILHQTDGTGSNGRSQLFFRESDDRFASSLGNTTSPSNTPYTKGNWTVYSTGFSFDGVNSTAISYHNTGMADGGATVIPGSSDGSWRLGAHKSIIQGDFFDGPMAEIIAFSQDLSDVRRILIENYLSAKYNIALGTNDIYTMDNSGYDFEVTGIGQDGNGLSHRDAIGTGAVRIWNPNDLDNNEYLLWGHDNGAMGSTTSGVDGVVIEERLQRTWAISEAGDVGTVSISFDLGALANPLGSNLRLLVDRNGNGFADNDVSPITGSAIGDLVVFPLMNFQNGDRFTLGNTDVSVPLPIQLIEFNAQIENETVVLTWSTSSEINNDHFTLERSIDLQNWQTVTAIDGAGNSESILYYQTVDLSPFTGISYYRLKQTDYDGAYEYFGPERVTLERPFSLRLYPNPSRDRFIISTGFELHLGQVRVYNTFGIEMPLLLSKENGNTILDASQYAPGSYIVKISVGQGTISRHILKIP